MGKTPIEWTDKSWSPLRVRVKENAAQIAKAKGYTSLVSIAEKMAGHVGPHCEKVSPGCKQCYSEKNNHRCLPANGTGLPFDRRSRDLVDPFVDTKILKQPLSWRGSQRIFVQNQSDLFGEWVPDEHIDLVFDVAAFCPQHTLQILTKQPKRMLRYCEERARKMARIRENECPSLHNAFPDALPNVWLGVSAEDPEAADARITLLRQTPAAVRFVSYEPALAPVDFTPYLSGLDWVIAGWESGPGARPAQEEWIRAVKDQCKAAGVSFFYKQAAERGRKIPTPLLDGRHWKEFPEVAA